MAAPGIEELQTAMLALLKLDAVLVAAVGQEIREDNWTGSQFKYPAVRVALPMIGASPFNGNCFRETVDVRYTIYGYGEGTSSMPAARILDLIRSAAEGKEMPNITHLVRLNFASSSPPVPEGERLWRGEVQFNAVVKKKI